MNDKLLKNKTALVTGGSHGIGKASARALAEAGAAVVIMGRTRDSLERTQQELMRDIPHARIEIVPGDACAKADVVAALEFTHSINNGIDILVPVVGGPVFKPLLIREVEDVREEFNLNFNSTFLMVRHGAPLMNRDGSIVCVSTIAVTQPGWGMSIYAASKAAVERFVKAAALELAGGGLRINAVRPGATLSAEDAANPQFAAMMAAYVAETPMGRQGLPEDIGRVVRFLAGPESGWVTGQTFSVDGGLEQGKSPDFMDAMFGKKVMDAIRAVRSIGDR